VAKAKVGSSTSSVKISLNKKAGKGKAKKSFGPKDSKPKKYVGQGR
jgi:hypothetical protein